MTEFVHVPYGSRCRDCGCRVQWLRLWCGPCDEARRVTAESHGDQESLKVATS